MYVVYDKRNIADHVNAKTLDDVHTIIQEARFRFVRGYGFKYVNIFDDNIKYSLRQIYFLKVIWPFALLSAVVGALMALV